MIKLKVTASWPQLERERFINDYQTAIFLEVEKAARKFLLAAAALIPIWTGFARGALYTLEERVGRVEGNSVNGSRKIPRSKLTTTRRGYYYKGIERTNLNGREFGTPKDEIITMGRLTKATTRGRVVFYYSVNIDYFSILDTKKWGAFKAGNEAFNADIRERLSRFEVDIGKYTVTRELTTT